MVVQLIRNQQVMGSNPIVGSLNTNNLRELPSRCNTIYRFRLDYSSSGESVYLRGQPAFADEFRDAFGLLP